MRSRQYEPQTDDAWFRPVLALRLAKKTMGDSQISRLTSLRNFGSLLRDARAGETFALGQLLNAYRPLLLVLADSELEHELRKKANPSDLVQETFVEAQRDFAQFKASTELEFRAWLTRLLENNLIDFRRHYKSRSKRDLARERPLSSIETQVFLNEMALKRGETPSKAVARADEEEALKVALCRIRPEYRRVIEWHIRDRLTFTEIGATIERSPDAVRMLYNRAVIRLAEAWESLRSNSQP